MGRVDALLTTLDRDQAKTPVGAVARWAGRTVARAAGFEQGHLLHEKMENNDRAEFPVLSGARMLGSGLLSVGFPAWMAVRQSGLRGNEHLGGFFNFVPQWIAFGFDTVLNGAAITLPFVGHLGRLGYHGAIAGIAEALPQSKEYRPHIAQRTRR